MAAEQASTATRIAFDAHGRLIASFPESMKFSRDLLNRPANLSRLADAISAACGRSLALSLEIHPDPPGGVVGAAPGVSRRQQQADAADIPFVRCALELFEGDAERMKYIPPRPQDKS